MCLSLSHLSLILLFKMLGLGEALGLGEPLDA